MAATGDGMYTIDASKCTGCVLCTRVCFLGRIELEGTKARVLEDRHCIGCGHCFAVCPSGAVTAPNGESAPVECEAPQKPSYEQLMELLRWRRSRREFKPDRVPQDVIDKLLRAAQCAPNGLNRREVGFTVITDSEAISRISAKCVVSMRRMAAILANRFVRPVLQIVAKNLYNEVMNLLPEIDALASGFEAGRDVVLYNAPCVILVHSPKSDICGPENALYCAGNILLAAETLGLGACVIGFVTGPIKHDPEIKNLAELPAGRTVHTTIAIGYPEFSYQRPAPVPEPATTLVK